MSTAQQLGLIGNSIKVQSLPTASAETFGAGNRFYTLIGQQEGYITGHTYRTVVANDVYSWEDVAGGNYNMLDNIPVINQDLSASGFTPVANTYYRHTGATTDTFTQGVIYLYDTAYHKLGESGGGTTLNKYEWTITYGFDSAKAMRLARIFDNSKGRIRVFGSGGAGEIAVDKTSIVGASDKQRGVFYAHSDFYTSEYVFTRHMYMLNGNNIWTGVITISANGTLSNSHSDNAPIEPLRVVYYNDTEIT